MSHVRTQMRSAVAALLADVSADVLVERVYSVDPERLPALSVWVRNESITRGGIGALDRSAEIIVDCLAKGSAVDDVLDGLLAAVETRLTTQTLGGLTAPLVPSQIEYEVSAEGSVPIGRARLTYEALYRTSPTDPEHRI
jgi:hypothetical protein